MTEAHAPKRWVAQVRVDKYEGDWSAEEIEAGLAEESFVETVERQGNLLTIGGVSALNSPIRSSPSASPSRTSSNTKSGRNCRTRGRMSSMRLASPQTSNSPANKLRSPVRTTS